MRFLVLVLLAGCAVAEPDYHEQALAVPAPDMGEAADLLDCPGHLHRVCLDSEECHWFWCVEDATSRQ